MTSPGDHEQEQSFKAAITSPNSYRRFSGSLKETLGISFCELVD